MRIRERNKGRKKERKVERRKDKETIHNGSLKITAPDHLAVVVLDRTRDCKNEKPREEVRKFRETTSKRDGGTSEPFITLTKRGRCCMKLNAEMSSCG